MIKRFHRSHNVCQYSHRVREIVLRPEIILQRGHILVNYQRGHSDLGVGRMVVL
jgi:hypothetical protein